MRVTRIRLHLCIDLACNLLTQNICFAFGVNAVLHRINLHCLQSAAKQSKTCRNLFVKTSTPLLQALSTSSKAAPTGSSRFQASRCKTDIHDPLLQTGLTALTLPHPHLWRTTSPCLSLRLQEDKSSGRDGQRRDRRRKEEEGGETMGRTFMDINIKTYRTKVHTSGQDAAAKMELSVSEQHMLLLPPC